MSKKSRKPKRRGIAAVETALVLPVFLVFVFAIMEFGQAYLCQHLLSNAARLGAREAMFENSENADVTQTVKNFCVNSLGVTAADVTVSFDLRKPDGSAVLNNSLSHATAGDICEVQVRIDYATVSLFPAAYLGDAELMGTYTLEHE